MPSRARVESNRLLRRWAAGITGDVLSIGSGDDRDREGRLYRAYFPAASSYTTSEPAGGASAGCDLILDVRAMPEVPGGRYDAIFCSGVLEHVDDLHAALGEIRRVLAPGGVLLLGVPFRQAVHRAPQDFWRFTRYGLRYLLADYEDVEVVAVDAANGPEFPATYWARARKPARTLLMDDEDRTVVEVAPPQGASDQAAAPADQPPLSVVCWLWAPEHGYRVRYVPAHVNALRRMVARQYPKPHRFLCVTDQVEGLDPEITVVPPWHDFPHLPSPHGRRFPSCYRRLRSFAPDIAETFGPRFVSLDLDVVITGDLRPLWDRPEPFVAWRDTHPKAHYNGSMILLTAGARPEVWTTFDPATSPRRTWADGRCNGSDQGWISFVLGPDEATWTDADGVYSWKNEIRATRRLPANARIVVWHGREKPWEPSAQRLPWVREHYTP